jgi:hypothetical protein
VLEVHGIFLAKAISFNDDRENAREIYSLSALSHMLTGKHKTNMTAYTKILRNSIDLSRKSYGHPPIKDEMRNWVLNFVNQKFPVTLKVVEVGKNIITAEFVNPSQELREAISSDAMARELASGLGPLSLEPKSKEIEGSQSVREIDPRILSSRHEGTPHWYKYGDRAELFLIEKLGEVIYFYVALENWCLECSATGELKFSKVNRNSSIKLQKEIDLLEISNDDQIPAIRMSVYFIDHADIIEPSLRHQMSKLLTSKVENI